jgi:hypothetical protein
MQLTWHPANLTFYRRLELLGVFRRHHQKKNHSCCSRQELLCGNYICYDFRENASIRVSGVNSQRPEFATENQFPRADLRKELSGNLSDMTRT